MFLISMSGSPAMSLSFVCSVVLDPRLCRPMGRSLAEISPPVVVLPMFLFVNQRARNVVRNFDAFSVQIE